MILELCIGLGALLSILYYKLSKNKHHWSERGVPNTGFRFLWGDDKDVVQQTKSFHQLTKENYFKFPGERFYGGWTMMGMPYLMLRNDFELIKAIWIKDFDHFNTTSPAQMYENIWPSSRAERLATQSLATIHGEVWKDLRSSFTPIFTSGKLKKMLPLLQEINNTIESYIKERTKTSGDIELKDLMGKLSMDALASCAFGVDSGSFTNENSEFVRNAAKIFEFASPEAMFQSVVAMFTPHFLKKFMSRIGFTNFATIAHLKENKFFHDVVEASIKQRKESKTRRNDLVDLMIDATECNPDEDDKLETESKLLEHNIKKTKNLSYDQIVSTASALLVAGYDTTGTTMSYVLYELAMHQDFQEALFEEIETATKETDDDGLSYETIHELPYLDAVINETLRRHPVIPILERPCTKEYKLPDTDIVIKKGDLIRLNNIGICFDPDIFPNPDEWNPDNFSKENRANRSPYTFLAFSTGPRNCIAMRFAYFEMKVAISHLVSKFKILPTNKTCKEIEVDPKSMLGAAKGELFVKFEERCLE